MSIQIKIGDLVQEIESFRIGEIIDIVLTPNGTKDKELIVILYVKLFDRIICSTSDKFKVLLGRDYEAFYPTVHLNNLSSR